MAGLCLWTYERRLSNEVKHKASRKGKKKLTFSPSGFEPCVIFSCEQEIFFFFDVKHLDYVQETALTLGLPA